MSAKSKRIDLTGFRSANSKILSGRDEGFDARRRLKIEELDQTDEIITVFIPKDTWSFNASFFLGLFGESIRDLTEKKFRGKYQFDCTDSIREDIEDGIVDAQKNNSALGGK